MNKNELVERIIERLRADYEESLEAINETAETATHEENIAKSKYETKSVEAAYLVEGQLKRNAELESEIAAYQAMRIRTFDQKCRILLSALIELEDEHSDSINLFMGPQAGGIVIDGIQVITPPSPLGQALLGKYCGEQVSVELDGKTQRYQIISLS
ncbi:GreA/GreB family elongation factor [Lentisphaera marina]|uniref:GreA/GreB family elongation factor n=1 Tax=Lentisphaera marina TaxID=1111041 RepID=UPI002366AAC2|nr:GreA/GreB family elongation factor [Lentisphaera marina]MDD7983413.1 GreA/GreB family elongation factor [Lentisphaera marina]